MVIPIYKAPSESFEADTCQPLVEAVNRGELRLAALVHGHYPGRKLPADELVGLKSIGYWDADRDQTWGLPWHRNEGIEVTFLETGKIGFGTDGQEHTLYPDALTITRPWQFHQKRPYSAGCLTCRAQSVYKLYPSAVGEAFYAPAVGEAFYAR